jgi:hypothetical protein
MQDSHARFDELAQWFETLTPETLKKIDQIYAPDATFRDPFNRVCGSDSIRLVYQHMFEQLVEPRFVIITKLIQGPAAFMTWQFLFNLRGKAYVIEGGTHFSIDDLGLIVEHRDYWDAAQELYEKIPLLGSVLRALRRKLSIAGLQS